MISNDRNAIGNRAYAARTNRNLKQIDVSDELGINQSTYSKFENGKYDLPLSELIKLCNYLNISSSWLIGECTVDLTDSEALELDEYKKYILNKRNK